jgi:hypothetical protein
MCCCSCSPICLFTAHMGSGPSPLLWSFPPTTTFTSFPTPGCLGMCHCSCLLQLACCEGFPLPLSFVLGVPHPLCYISFCCYCLLLSFFFFFPWVGVGLSRGLADLAQGCLWESHVQLSSPCGLHLPKPFGYCRLAAAWEPSWFLHLM